MKTPAGTPASPSKGVLIRNNPLAIPSRAGYGLHKNKLAKKARLPAKSALQRMPSRNSDNTSVGLLRVSEW
jgi:hypothetical protein